MYILVLCDAVPEEGAYFASGLREQASVSLALVERLRALGWRPFDARDSMARCIERDRAMRLMTSL
jgi:hypothetical protein